MKVILVMAITIDGKIGKHAHHAVDWTGKEDKRKFVQMTRRAGVMVMGSRTFDTIGSILPNRRNIVMTRDKTRVSDDENLVFTDKGPGTIIAGLEKEGFESVCVIGGALVNSLFIKAGLIDELYITLVPKLFGTGLSLFDVDIDVNLELLEVETIDSDYLLLKYAVN